MKCSLSQKILLMIVTVMVMLPFLQLSAISASEFDQKRMVELIVLSLALLYCIIIDNQHTINLSICKLILLVVLVLALLSSSIAPSPRYALIETFLLFGLWCLVLAVATITCTNTVKMVMLISLILLFFAGCYLTGIAAAYLASLIEHIPLHWNNLFYGYSNVRFFNQFQIWTFPLLIVAFAFISANHRTWRWLAGFVIAIWWMLLFLSASRGALLAITAAVIVTHLIYRPITNGFIRYQLFFILTGLSSYYLLFELLPAMLVDGPTWLAEIARLEGQDSTRVQLWRDAITMIIDNPWLGVGPMHFAWYPNAIAAHPHNSILQWTAELGLPSLGLMLMLVCHGIYHWLSRFNANTLPASGEFDQLVPIALFCSLTAGLGYSLVSGVIVMPQSQMMLALVMGLMVALYQEHGVKRPEIKQKLLNIIFRSLCFIVLVGILIFVWPQVSERFSANFKTDLSVNYTHAPRFWQNGGIPHE